MASQYTCPVSLSAFLGAAKPLMGELRPHGEGGPVIPIMLTPKEFSSGSYGWFLSAPGSMDVGGRGKAAAGPARAARTPGRAVPGPAKGGRRAGRAVRRGR